MGRIKVKREEISPFYCLRLTWYTIRDVLKKVTMYIMC